MSDYINDYIINAAMKRMCCKDNSSKICWYCNKISNKDLLACGKCSIARYCDRKCQKKDWKTIHKIVCIIHREDIDDATNSDLGLTPSMDLFNKAVIHHEAKNNLKAERLYKNLLLLLRNTVRDHEKLVELLRNDISIIETLHSNVLVDDMNDTNCYTGALHNVASILCHLNKPNDAESFLIKAIDANHQICGGRDVDPFAINSMESLVKLYTSSPLNRQSEIDTLNERIAAIKALKERQGVKLTSEIDKK